VSRRCQGGTVRKQVLRDGRRPARIRPTLQTLPRTCVRAAVTTPDRLPPIREVTEDTCGLPGPVPAPPADWPIGPCYLAADDDARQHDGRRARPALLRSGASRAIGLLHPLYDLRKQEKEK